MTKHLIFAFCFLFASSGVSAQKPVWHPSTGHMQVPIWPGAAPDAQPVAEPEVSGTTGKESLVGGRPLPLVGLTLISVTSLPPPTSATSA